MELIEAREQSEKLYQQAFAAKDEIERRLAAGDITDAEAQQALQVAGQYAGMARSQILENEIAQRTCWNTRSRLTLTSRRNSTSILMTKRR